VITTVLAFVFVLGVLVFVHELGHFVAAKRIGVKVLKFQLGFNPTIASFRRGDTEYGIGALPFGGYVKMAGENPDETRAGRPDEFLSRTKWERFQILFMGPLMNLVLAVVLSAVVLYQGAEVPAFESQPPVIGSVNNDSPAARSGIEAGDRIVSVAGSPVETWHDVYLAVGARPYRQIIIGVVRDGRELMRQVTTVAAENSRFDIGDIGVLPAVRPKLIAISSGEPGERAGLKAGDLVLAVNGATMAGISQLRDAISRHPEEPITMTVLRDGAPLEVAVTPARVDDVGRIGVQIGAETRTIDPGLVGAVRMSVERNVQYSGLIFQTVWGLFTRETSPRQLMGPVAIAQLSGESAEIGWIALFSLMSMISLNLGLLNLLPIPILDGGHICIMAIEGIARRDFSMRVKEKMLLAGFVVLMMLMVTVIYNDLARIAWIERLMPWR
jgi:regulator of sigma E protease